RAPAAVRAAVSEFTPSSEDSCPRRYGGKSGSGLDFGRPIVEESSTDAVGSKAGDSPVGRPCPAAGIRPGAWGAEMMGGIKASLVLASMAVVGLAVWAGAYVDQTGSRMAVAADRFLRSLDAGLAKKARYDFDSEERLNWHFIPRERNGVPIKDLFPE